MLWRAYMTNYSVCGGLLTSMFLTQNLSYFLHHHSLFVRGLAIVTPQTSRHTRGQKKCQRDGNRKFSLGQCQRKQSIGHRSFPNSKHCRRGHDWVPRSLCVRCMSLNKFGWKGFWKPMWLNPFLGAHPTMPDELVIIPRHETDYSCFTSLCFWNFLGSAWQQNPFIVECGRKGFQADFSQDSMCVKANCWFVQVSIWTYPLYPCECEPEIQLCAPFLLRSCCSLRHVRRSWEDLVRPHLFPSNQQGCSWKRPGK